MNAGLDAAPGWTLFAFVLIDMGSALCLYALFAAAKVPVDADFALAYAVSKSIRAPRLALGAFCFFTPRRFPRDRVGYRHWSPYDPVRVVNADP